MLITADTNLNTLAGLVNTNSNRFLQSVLANNGQDGDRQFLNVKYGNDLIMHIPHGTIVEEEIVVKKVEIKLYEFSKDALPLTDDELSN